jgi:Prokaryotic E2 family E
MEAERLEQELALLRSAYPDLEYRLVEGAHWVRIPTYSVPSGWAYKGSGVATAEIAFQIPTQAGQAPYAFYVRPAITLVVGDTPSNYTATATTPWGDDFAQFSWSPHEPWVPKTDIRAGANMHNFAHSFVERLSGLS